MRDQVFISYSHRDSSWLQRLQVYLAPIERRGGIRRWDDTLIAPGHRWEREIEAALKRTRVAILLVSAEFLASDFISRMELPRLLGAAENQGVLIIPVVLDHCNFERCTELARNNFDAAEDWLAKAQSTAYGASVTIRLISSGSDPWCAVSRIALNGASPDMKTPSIGAALLEDCANAKP